MELEARPSLSPNRWAGHKVLFRWATTVYALPYTITMDFHAEVETRGRWTTIGMTVVTALTDVPLQCLCREEQRR